MDSHDIQCYPQPCMPDDHTFHHLGIFVGENPCASLIPCIELHSACNYQSSVPKKWPTLVSGQRLQILSYRARQVHISTKSIRTHLSEYAQSCVSTLMAKEPQLRQKLTKHSFVHSSPTNTSKPRAEKDSEFWRVVLSSSCLVLC